MELQEREAVLDRLKKNRERVLAAVSGLSHDQLVFRPAEDQWSMADCLEHINIVESRVYMGIQRALSQPPEPEKGAAVANKRAMIESAALDRTTKFAGPAQVMPHREWSSFPELVEAFESIRGRTLQFVEQTTSRLHDHVFPHPVFQDMDCYQWLLLLDLHAERHISQMEEVKAAQVSGAHQS